MFDTDSPVCGILELQFAYMSNTERLGNHRINFTLPDDIPSSSQIPASCTASRIETSPSLKQTFFNYIGKGLQQLNRMKSPPPRIEDPIQPFKSYLDTIGGEMTKLKKYRRTRQKARQIAIENVQTCYNKIPPVYFTEDFQVFSLPHKKKTRAAQQQLGNHLDMVELTLFSQVTANFNQYLGLMSSMEDLDELIDKGIQKVQRARAAITLTQRSFMMKAARIQGLLQKRITLEKTLQAAIITKRLGSISEELRATMSKGTWDKEVFTAISASIKQWEVVRKVQAISRFGSQIDKLQNQGKYYLKQQIQMGFLLLIEPSLKYSKEKWMAQGVPKNAVVPQDDAQNNTINMSVQITVLDQSYFDQNGQEQDHQEQDAKQTEKLCGIIGFCCDLGYTENNVWFLIEGKLTHFNDQFFRDVKEYLSFILERSGNVAVKSNWTLNKLLEYIEIGFYCKIVFAYFEIVKKVFLKLNTLIELTAGNGFLNELQKGMNDFIINQLKLFLGLKKISAQTDYQTFLKYLSIIDYWIQCQSELICLNLKNLDQTRSELIDFYITNVHKQILTVQLKQAMEADKFVPCPIPSDYYHQLDYLFNGGKEEESFNMNDQTFNMSICRDRRAKKITELEQSTNNSKVRVMNKVLNVNGKSYMVSESFLLLLEILEQYVQMAGCMPSHKQNIEEKINELLGFYNWYLKELVLNAGILKFSSSIKNVMVKHMSLSIHLVQLMDIIWPRIPVEKPDPKKKLETALKSHLADLNKKISTVIVYRLQDEIAVLYQSRISQKNAVPVTQSKNIIAIISNAKQTMFEFFSEEKVKQLLNNAIKMINKGYFNYLLSLGKRGYQELDWFLAESEKAYSQLFGDQITEMKQQLKKRRR